MFVTVPTEIMIIKNIGESAILKSVTHTLRLRFGNTAVVKIHSQTFNLVPPSDAVAKLEREQHFQQEQVDETAHVCLFTKSRV